jgi:hypothetical protein
MIRHGFGVAAYNNIFVHRMTFTWIMYSADLKENSSTANL